jgi:hypothetical protein
MPERSAGGAIRGGRRSADRINGAAPTGSTAQRRPDQRRSADRINGAAPTGG